MLQPANIALLGLDHNDPRGLGGLTKSASRQIIPKATDWTMLADPGADSA